MLFTNASPPTLESKQLVVMEQPGAPIRLVVADDHAVTRAGICRWLDEELDLEVVGQAQNGREALQMIQRHSPDVLLTDIELPDLRGLELVPMVWENHPNVSIVLMTAYKGWYIREVMEVGGVGYLSKEGEREMFVLAIRWAARGKCWIDPEELREEIDRARELDHLGLTPTERRILALIDRPNEDISKQLGMKETTLRKTHLSNIFFKIGVNKRHEAIAWARRKKLTERDHT